MRGRYNGCTISVSGEVIPSTGYLVKIPVDLSGEAKQRLKWFDYYQSHGQNARLTCRHFGIGPQTFYRWKRRYDPHNLKALENRWTMYHLR